MLNYKKKGDQERCLEKMAKGEDCRVELNLFVVKMHSIERFIRDGSGNVSGFILCL